MSNFKLYQIEESINALLTADNLNLEDLEQATILDEQLHQKLDNMLAFYAQENVQIEAFENNLKAKLEEIKANKKRNENLKAFIITKMNQYSINELRSTHFKSAKLVSAGSKPVIVDENYPISNVPDDFKKIEVSISKTAIKEALEAGEVLEFARLGEQTKILKLRG
jgi:hypothetical protein